MFYLATPLTRIESLSRQLLDAFLCSVVITFTAFLIAWQKTKKKTLKEPLIQYLPAIRQLPSAKSILPRMKRPELGISVQVRRKSS